MALSDNLISYWSLDETSGNAIDAHGSNNLTETDGTIGSSTGKVGNCRDFEAADVECFRIADNADLSAGDIDFTLTCWVRMESLAASMYIIGKDDVSASREYALLFSVVSNRFRFDVSSNGSTTVQCPANSFGVPSSGTWYFLVAWHDASANTINIQVNNGTVDSVVHSTGVFNGTASFNLGATSVGTPSVVFDGLIDEVGFWKRVLTSAERAELYNNGNGQDYNYIYKSSFPTNKIFLQRAFPSILNSLEDRKQIQYPAQGEEFEFNYTFPLLVKLLQNKTALNNSKFNINNNFLRNTLGQIISEHDINFNNIDNLNAQLNKKFNINHDIIKNNVGQTNKEYIVNFNLNKNTTAQSNKYLNIRYNLTKNLQALISDNYSVHLNLNDSLNATKNKTFNLNINLRKNTVALIGPDFNIVFETAPNIIAANNLNFLLPLAFNLLSNKTGIINSRFNLNTNINDQINALKNKSFNIDYNLIKNINALIGPNFNITFHARQNLAAENDITFFLPLVFNLLSNKIGLINPYFNFNINLDDQFNALKNKIFNIDYDLFKNTDALINPDFDVLFQQFKQSQSHKQVSYDIDFNLLYDILLVEAGGNTFLVDYVFSILFNLLSNKNAINNTNLGINLDLSKNILFQKDRQFNIPLNIIQQGIRLKNSDLIIPLGRLATNLDVLKQTLFNLNLDFNKQLTSTIDSEFETTFAIPKHIAANLNYQFPLIIEFSHDIETTIVIHIIPDNIDDTLWCHVKSIRTNSDVKTRKISIGIDKIIRYGVEE